VGTLLSPRAGAWLGRRGRTSFCLPFLARCRSFSASTLSANFCAVAGGGRSGGRAGFGQSPVAARDNASLDLTECLATCTEGTDDGLPNRLHTRVASIAAQLGTANQAQKTQRVAIAELTASHGGSGFEIAVGEPWNACRRMALKA